MKLGTTLAALALIGAAASTSALAESQSADIPHALTAPKAPSSFMGGKATKSRTVTFQAKAGTQDKMMAQPPTSEPKR
jgi:hypothetical protein